MSTSWFRAPSGYSAMYQRLQGFGCTSSFMEFKTQTEKEISELGRKTHSEFCKKCVNLKETIIKKDREFQGCLADRSKQLKLIDVNGEIKDFVDECISVYSQCFQKRSSRDRKPVEIKRKSEKSCEKNRPCKNEKARTGGVGSKEQQRLGTETSKRGISPRQKLQSTGAQQAEGKDSKQQIKVSETPKLANTLDNPVKTQHGGSESVNNHQSITSAQVKTSIQPLTASDQEITTEVDNHTISPTPLSRSRHESDSGIPVPGSHTNKGPVPKNSPDNQSYRNTPGEQDTAENIALGKDLAREVVVTETPDSEVSAGKDFVQTHHRGPNADGLQSSSSDTSNVAAIHVHVGNPHPNTVITDGNTSLKVNGEVVDHEHPGSKGPHLKDSVTEGFAESDTVHDNISNRGRDDTKISDINGYGDELRSSEGSCSEPTCSTEKGNILTDDKSYIFRRIFDAISNKEHIIQASAPMGIVLLLTLLFKYTPLWRVLTKKKRKKHADTNEELHNVLQEPSIFDEERSIPFSYGAFEYSS